MLRKEKVINTFDSHIEISRLPPTTSWQITKSIKNFWFPHSPTTPQQDWLIDYSVPFLLENLISTSFVIFTVDYHGETVKSQISSNVEEKGHFNSLCFSVD